MAKKKVHKVCYGCGGVVTRETVERFTRADLCPDCFERLGR